MVTRIRAINRLCLLVLAILICTYTYAADSLRIGLAAADKIFLDKNLSLLAGRLNVSAQKAAEIQARLYPNPALTGEVNAYDPENKQLFHTGAGGQKVVGIEQLIILGGKRHTEIELARQNTVLAGLELEDLLRNLKQQLHTSYYSVYFDGLTLRKYDVQLQVLDTIIANYELQAQKGNISLKELVRLKSVYLNLNNDKTELLQNIRREQQSLQVLLQTNADVLPIVNADSLAAFMTLPSADSLVVLAMQYRPDRKMTVLSSDIAALNLRYQKSLAIPDLTLGSGYDQAGGAFRNQVNLTLGMSLPMWHRNQGNVKVAKIQVTAAGVQEEISRSEITAEVAGAYNNMLRSMQEYNKSKQLYNTDFKDVFNGITDNFRKRNISIIEFVDFFESYNESVAAINRIRKQVALCAEAINYTTACTIY